MHPTLASLLSTRPVVLDGAWGTQMQSLGLQPGEHPDLWNLSHPDRVREVASRYVQSGSRVILTNTFRSNRLALSAQAAAGEMAEIVVKLNTAGVKISQEAAAGKAMVFASVGPSGKMLMSGDVTEEELAAAFGEQTRALADAGADGIVLETMSDLFEAQIALKAAKATGLPVVVSMVYDSGPQRDRTMMGATPERAAAVLEGAGADVVGANCGLGMDAHLPICTRLRKATTLPVWIKPNAGLPEIVDGKVHYRTAETEFAAMAPQLRAAGADFIGGCCGTTPAFIREVVARLAECA